MFNASAAVCVSLWTESLCYSSRDTMIFSLVRHLHVMHYPEIAMCKSLSPYEELPGKDFCGHNFDLQPFKYAIVRRMLYGDHQIFCNIISSDMELSINIGKLHETMKKKKTKGKGIVTLHISNYRLT